MQRLSATSASSPSVLDSRSHRLLIGALIAASLVPIWSATYFPSQNGPWHVLVSKMLHDYFAGTSFNYFDYYQFAPHLIPHLLHTALVSILHVFVPILIAHKLVISLYVVLLPLSVFTFLSTADPRKSVYGYASFLLVYNLPLMRGYHDFALGIPIVLFTIAYWIRTAERQTTARWVTLAALVLVAFLSHIFNFLILGLTFLVLEYYRTRSVRRTIVALLPFVPASVFVADFAIVMLTKPAWMSRSDLEIFAPHRALEHLYEFTNTLSPYAAVVMALPFLFILYAAGRAARESVAEYRRTGNVPAGVYALLLAVFSIAYFAMPHKFFGWHFANTRFIPYVLVALLAFSAPLAASRLRRAFVGVTALAAVVAYGLLTVQFMRADLALKGYVSGLDHVRANPVLYPINFRETPFGEILPLTRAHEYYHVFRGGANGRGIAMYSSLTPMPYREYPVQNQFPVWRPHDSDRRTARMADHYDYVLSWGWREDFAEAMSKASFTLTYQRGDLYLYENDNAPSARLGGDSGARE